MMLIARRPPCFPHTKRHQQLDPLGQDGHGRCKGRGINAKRVTGREQNVIETSAFGLKDDIPTVLEAGLQPWIRNAKELVIVIA